MTLSSKSLSAIRTRGLSVECRGSEPSELEPALACAIGKRLDAPVVLVGAAVEHDALDAGREGPLGQLLPDGLGLIGLVALGRQRPAVRLCHGDPALVVDHLAVDEARAAEHGEPEPARVHRPLDAPAGPEGASLRSRQSVHDAFPRCGRRLAGCRLTGLELHVFACVPHALAVVVIRRADGPDVGGDLADQLLVDPAHRDLGGLGGLDAHAFGRRDDDGMRVSDRQLQVAALHLAAEADALDLEVLLEAAGDAGHGVGNQAAGQAVLGSVVAVIAGSLHGDDAVVDRHADPRADDDLELPLRALDLDQALRHLELDALRKRDGSSAYARHLTTPRRRSRRPCSCGGPRRRPSSPGRWRRPPARDRRARPAPAWPWRTRAGRGTTPG